MSKNASNIIIGPATLSIDGTDVGYTRDGIRIRMEREYKDTIPDQAVGVVKKAKILERMMVATTLLEATDENLKRAWDQDAASNSLGNDSEQELSNITIEGKAPDGGTRTFSLNKAISINDAEFNMGREEEGVLEIELECLKDAQGKFGSVNTTE